MQLCKTVPFSKDWSWFALQLKGNREVYVLDVEFLDGTHLLQASYTDAACRTTVLDEDDFSIVATEDHVFLHASQVGIS